jgi:hypothetical protein
MTEFNAQQMKTMKQLFSHLPSTIGFGNAEKFLLQFVSFEAAIRLVGRYYRARIYQKKKPTGYEPLNIEVVRRSLKYFDVQISDELLDNLLASKTKRDHKSARDLRGGLVHHWKIEDVKEVEARFENLCGNLSLGIEKIGLRSNCVRK